jgi:hypothetical protein
MGQGADNVHKPVRSLSHSPVDGDESIGLFHKSFSDEIECWRMDGKHTRYYRTWGINEAHIA